MLAISAESLIKLVSFLAIGAFVVWGMFDGLADLTRHATTNPAIVKVVSTQPDAASWTVMTLLSGFAILLLPRQFHVTVVENRDIRDVRRAAWILPLYLVAINIFVIPLAIATGEKCTDTGVQFSGQAVQYLQRRFYLIVFDLG